MSPAKSIEALTAIDLQANPIWSWATDAEIEGDETYVEPQSLNSVPVEGDFQVACTITIASGREFIGFISIRDGHFDDDAPTLTAGDGSTWDLMHPPHQKKREAFRVVFGCSFNELFPVRWMALLPFEGENAVRGGTYVSEVVEIEVSAKCPHCGGKLRSERAKQCPSCLRRWA